MYKMYVVMCACVVILNAYGGGLDESRKEKREQAGMLKDKVTNYVLTRASEMLLIS